MKRKSEDGIDEEEIKEKRWKPGKCEKYEEKRGGEIMKKFCSYQSERVMLSEGLNGERNHYRKRELHELIGTIE